MYEDTVFEISTSFYLVGGSPVLYRTLLILDQLAHLAQLTDPDDPNDPVT